MPFAATWVDLEIMILSEVNQTEKGKYHDIIYIWNLKYDTNQTYLQNTNKTHRHESKLMVTKGEREEERGIN